MRLMVLFVLMVGFGVLGYTIFHIRTVPSDPAVWHVDPLRAPPQPTPNGYRVAPVTVSQHAVDAEPPIYIATPEVLGAAFDTFVMGQPRVTRLAGSVEEGWITYIQRSESFQFPDYVSVRFLPLEQEGFSTIAIFSRSRFGHSDMGVNEARVLAWLNALRSFES